MYKGAMGVKRMLSEGRIIQKWRDNRGLDGSCSMYGVAAEANTNGVPGTNAGTWIDPAAASE